jgi:hypothetical protein
MVSTTVEMEVSALFAVGALFSTVNRNSNRWLDFEGAPQLTLPVANVTDFDDLPIPFRAVATDVNTGERAVLGEGQLASAIRASMALPGIFAPVELNGTLMVDGGGWATCRRRWCARWAPKSSSCSTSAQSEPDRHPDRELSGGGDEPPGGLGGDRFPPLGRDRGHHHRRPGRHRRRRRQRHPMSARRDWRPSASDRRRSSGRLRRLPRCPLRE